MRVNGYVDIRLEKGKKKNDKDMKGKKSVSR